MDDQTQLKRTPLYDLHVSLGAKMVPFAGYDMPVQYPAGVLKEHLHTRAAAGLFDVSRTWVRSNSSPPPEPTMMPPRRSKRWFRSISLA